MLLYYILIIIPTLIYLIRRLKGYKNDCICIIVFFLMLIILLSLRDISCGTDLKMYYYYFDLFSHSSFEAAESLVIKGEYLYYFLNKFITIIGGNYQLFLSVVAIISITPIAVLYYRKSSNGLLTIALFLIVAPFSMFFSGLRQAIAMGIIAYAFKYVQSKKLFNYVFFVLIAMFFHKSAIICLLLYPIYHAKITKNWMYIIAPLMIVNYCFNEQIFTFLLSNYNSIYDEMYGDVISTGQYAILILLVLFSIYCFVFPDSKKINQEFIGYRNILLLSVLLQSFVPINYIVMRLNYYFLIFVPLLIPMVEKVGYDIHKKILKLSVMIMIIFFFSYFIYNGYNGDDVLNIFPYIPYWG